VALPFALVPPVGIQYVDISAVLQEVAAQCAEVHATVAIENELATVGAAFSALMSQRSHSIKYSSYFYTGPQTSQTSSNNWPWEAYCLLVKEN
jgi:hypothetical protein